MTESQHSHVYENKFILSSWKQHSPNLPTYKTLERSEQPQEGCVWIPIIWERGWNRTVRITRVGKVIHDKSCCEDPLGKNGKVVLSLQGTKTETKYDRYWEGQSFKVWLHMRVTEANTRCIDLRTLVRGPHSWCSPKGVEWASLEGLRTYSGNWTSSWWTSFAGWVSLFLQDCVW